MWPFSKKVRAPVEAMSYSQVDITETFGDDQRLGPDEWIATTPLNATQKERTWPSATPIPGGNGRLTTLVFFAAVPSLGFRQAETDPSATLEGGSMRLSCRLTGS
jgi:hypothetical protein